MTVRGRFMAVVVMAIVPLFALSILKAMRNADAAIERAKADLLFAASLAAAGQERAMDSARQLLTLIASLPEVQRGKNLDCDRYFLRLTRDLPEYANLGILGLDGKTRCHALGSENRMFLGDREFFQTAVQDRRFVAGTYAVGRIAGRPVLPFARPVIGPDNKVTGVVFGSFDLARMARSVGGVHLPAGAALGVQDRQGALLAGKPLLPIAIGERVRSPVLREAVRTLGTGVREGPDGHGEARLWAFVPSSSRPEAALLVSVSMARELIVAPSRRELWLELATLAMMACIGGCLAWVVGGRAIVKPTRQLLEAARKVQEGRRDVRLAIPKADRDGEFSRISAGFNHMLDALDSQRNALEAELASSRAMQLRLNDAQRLGHIAYWEVDLASGGMWWSDEAGEVLGIEPALLGDSHEAFLARVLAEDRSIVAARWQAALAAGQSMDLEFRIITSSQTVRWIHQYGRAVSRVGQGSRRGGVLQDISERKRASEEIVQLNGMLEQRVRERTAQLELTNRELEAFSYSVSHDLRSPLLTIAGFANLLGTTLPQTENAAGARTQRYLSRIRAGVAQMGDLIDGLLLLAHTSQPLGLQAPVDLSAIARQLCAEYQARDTGRSARICIEDGLVANGDTRLLRQLLDNLLGNAWKFSARNELSEITFGSGSEGDGPVYFVRDNGVGFDMAYAEKLFAAFQRLHSGAEFPGSGIGLATSRRIVSRHGGSIWAESAVNCGASFYFTLPGQSTQTAQPDQFPGLAGKTS
jgi:signal transduction histidine kinase